MSEPTIIPLYTVFQDEQMLKRLHTIQRNRVAERALTRGERPTGARLSIDDPVRRVKAIFDSFWTTPVPEQIGERGYLCEDLLEAVVISELHGPYRGEPYTAQVEIPWGPEGEGWSSAFDYVMDGTRLVVSCKSSTTKPIHALTPSSANRNQERRMLALAGYPAGTEWETWMVHPGTLEARGPFVNMLTQDDIDAAHAEAAAVAAAYAVWRTIEKPSDHPAWNDPAEWQRRWGLTSSSGAFHLEYLDANPAIEKRVSAFARAMRARKAAERAYEDAKELLQPFVVEQVELARAAGRNVSKVQAHYEPIDFAIRSNGAFVPSERADREKTTGATAAA